MAGNWKMFKTPAETTAFFEKFLPLVAKSTHAEVAICPPFVNIAAAVEAAKGTRVGVGGQNCYWQNKEGAFTGEVTPAMLKAAGCQYVIIGHSERRQYFGETDATVLARTKAALEAGLTPMVCVGELLADREAGKTGEVLAAQFTGGIAGLTLEEFAQIVIAYEPIFLGTGYLPPRIILEFGARSTGEPSDLRQVSSAHSDDCDHRFRRIATTCSDRSRPVWRGRLQRRWMLMVMSVFRGLVKHGKSRPGSQQEGPARDAERPYG